jgi:hypothetical protein
MTQNIPNRPQHSAIAKPRSQKKHPKNQLREETEAALREIAFVLKMTKQIHDEMNAQEETAETVMA